MEEKTLIFDKWLNEEGHRLRAYRLDNQDIQFEVTQNGAVVLVFTLASYRAADLRTALGRTPNPDGS